MVEVVRDLLESSCSSRITPSARKEQENRKRKESPHYNKDALGERERNSMSPTEEMESWSINKVGMLSQGCAGLPGDAQHPPGWEAGEEDLGAWPKRNPKTKGNPGRLQGTQAGSGR